MPPSSRGMTAVVWRAAFLHRRVHEIPYQRPRVLPLSRSLHHEHGEQILLRVDPEERAGHAAPEELAGRAQERRDSGLAAHREAQAETVSGGHEVAVDLHLRRQMIGG